MMFKVVCPLRAANLPVSGAPGATLLREGDITRDVLLSLSRQGLEGAVMVLLSRPLLIIMIQTGHMIATGRCQLNKQWRGMAYAKKIDSLRIHICYSA